MLSRKLWATETVLAIFLMSGSLTSAYALDAATTTPSNSNTHPVTAVDDVQLNRTRARRQLMLTSLKGLRGIAYGVVHADNPSELEATMSKQLKQLDLPVRPFSGLKAGVKPVDGLLEIKVLKVPIANYVQLNFIQWVSLLREPKTEIRAVTYHDSLLAADCDLTKTVSELTDQFVIDVLKANQQTQTVAKEKPRVHRKVQ